MRIRIALTTAIAVIAGMTTGIFTLSISRQPASAQAATHQHDAHRRQRHAVPHRAVGLRRSGKTVAPTTTTTPRRTPATTAARHHAHAHDDTRPRHRHRRHRRPPPVTDATSVAHRRLDVHPGPRIGRPVQQSGRPVRGLRDPDQHLALVRVFGVAVPSSGQRAGPRGVGVVRARTASSRGAHASPAASRVSPRSRMAVTWPMSK